MSEYNAEPIQKIIMAHCSSTMSMDRCRNLGNDIAELVAAETDQLRQRVEQFAAGLTTIANRELPTEAWAAHHAKITLDGYHATVEQLLRQRVAESERLAQSLQQRLGGGQQYIEGLLNRIASLEEALKAIRDWPMYRADEISLIASKALKTTAPQAADETTTAAPAAR